MRDTLIQTTEITAPIEGHNKGREDIDLREMITIVILAKEIITEGMIHLKVMEECEKDAQG